MKTTYSGEAADSVSNIDTGTENSETVSNIDTKRQDENPETTETPNATEETTPEQVEPEEPEQRRNLRKHLLMTRTAKHLWSMS